jgi:hypothetical protein
MSDDAEAAHGHRRRSLKAGDRELARMSVDQLHDAWQKATALRRKEELQEAWPLLEILTHLLGDYIEHRESRFSLIPREGLR